MKNMNCLDEYTLSKEDVEPQKKYGNPNDYRGPNAAEYRSIVEQDYPKEQSSLYNPCAPNMAIQHENFRHHAIAYMMASGMTQKQVAEEMGMHVVTISNLARQPWFREKVARIVSQNGQPQVEQLLKGAAVKAVERLINEQDNMERETGGTSSTRIAAANAILDRVFGKATQPIVNASVDLNKLSDAELASMLPNIKPN